MDRHECDSKADAHTARGARQSSTPRRGITSTTKYEIVIWCRCIENGLKLECVHELML